MLKGSIIPKKLKIIAVCCIVSELTVSLFYHAALAQSSIKFSSPLHIPLELSANFGEIRSDHFHTGFDIRTNERTGYKVYASADGYISRIKVSAGGYGKALYLTHPNAYMTVYAHLEEFAEEIAAYVKDEQYSKQSFEVELFPPQSKFQVKQGDFIAFSGNSGSSGGPHLHFEIRDAQGETYPLNPGAFFELSDTIAPRFYKMHLYSLSDAKGGREKYIVRKKAFGYSLKPDSISVNSSLIGIGVEAKDFMNNTGNDFSVYEFSLKVDDQLIYHVYFNRLDFLNGRYVNAFIDYGEKKRSGTVIYKLFRMPGDNNSIYRDIINQGKIHLKDSAFHKIDVAARDVYGNVSHLIFYLKQQHKISTDKSVNATSPVMHYDRPNIFADDSIQLKLPVNILYEDLSFEYSMESTFTHTRYSALHHVHHSFTPVHSYYEVSLLPRPIQSSMKSKAVIVYEDDYGKRTVKTSQDWF